MDLNMKLDMGQIKEKLLGVSDKKTLIKFGIGLWCNSFIFNNLLCNIKPNG